MKEPKVFNVKHTGTVPEWHPLSFTIYMEIVLLIKSTNQKHGGFEVAVSLFSWGHPLTKFLPLKYLVSGVLHENKETVTSK